MICIFLAMIKFIYLKKQFNDNSIFPPTPCFLLACKTEVRSVSRLRLLPAGNSWLLYSEDWGRKIEKLFFKFYPFLLVYVINYFSHQKLCNPGAEARSHRIDSGWFRQSSCDVANLFVWEFPCKFRSFLYAVMILRKPMSKKM